METYLKAGISLAVVLFALVWVGCTPQVTPAPTSTPGPLLAEGEAIAIVQTWLSRIDDGFCLIAFSQAEWSSEYLGNGKWSVNAENGRKGSGKWQVFENSFAVRTSPDNVRGRC